jgi:hypothetical protein
MMLTKSKVRAAIVAGLACSSIGATASLASTGAEHGPGPVVHALDARSGPALLAQCRAEKSSGVAGGACAALSASGAGIDPSSTPALSTLLQQCLAAKAGQPGASPAACAALDQASGN